MFELVDRPVVWLPVRWPGLIAGPDGEPREVEHEITAQFELLDDSDEIARIFFRSEPARDDETPEQFDARTERTNADILAGMMKIMRDWRDLKASGKPLPFSEANVARMLNLPGFGGGVRRTYLAAINGRAEIRTGNSAGSLPGGRAVESEAGASPTETTPKSGATAPAGE